MAKFYGAVVNNSSEILPVMATGSRRRLVFDQYKTYFTFHNFVVFSCHLLKLLNVITNLHKQCIPLFKLFLQS